MDENKTTRVERLLYIGDLRTGRTSASRMDALREYCDAVVGIDRTEFLGSPRWIKRIEYHIGVSHRILWYNRAVICSVRTFDPDVIWVDKGRYLHRWTLKLIRSESEALLVHYNPDDVFGQFDSGWGVFIRAIPHYDVHLVPRPQNIDEYRDLGAENVLEYDRSFDPRIHRPVDIDEDGEFAHEVGFVGSWAHDRAQSIAFLIQEGIPVHVRGDGWRDQKGWDVIAPYYLGPSVFGDEYARAWSGLEIGLHFLRKENRDEQDSRTFEIPACGTFMLAERTEKHRQLFEEGREAEFFDGRWELLEKVQKYRRNTQLRESIANAGYQRCVESQYDIFSRMGQLLDKVSGSIATCRRGSAV